MDLELQKSNNNGGKAKARAINKFLGVRQRPSGKWVAEIKNTTKKIRMWLGTFNTAEEAARAYDEAACLLRGSNTRTNFAPKHVSSDSPLSVKIRNLLHEKKHRSTSTTTTAPAAVCTRSQQSLPLVAPSKACIEPTTSSMTTCVSVGTDSPSISQEDVYTPDLIEFQQGLSPFDQLCTFPLTHHRDFGLPCESQDLEITEFERMRVERQISASLYAINGVNEFLENVYLPDDLLWDFPDSLVLPNMNHTRYLC